MKINFRWPIVACVAILLLGLPRSSTAQTQTGPSPDTKCWSTTQAQTQDGRFDPIRRQMQERIVAGRTVSIVVAVAVEGKIVWQEGIVRLKGGRCNQAVPAPYSTNAHLRFPLSSSPFSRRDYQSLRLVVFSLRPELPRCRRNVSDARRRTHLRDGSRMVPQVRPDLCQWLAPQISSTRRPLAPRRSVPQDQWASSLPLACSGSGR